MSDRYLRIVLTVIAVELFWIGIKDLGTPAAAQAAPVAQAAPAAQPAPPQPTRVIVTGIDLDPARMAQDPARRALPVYATQTVKVDSDRPLPVVGAAPFTVRTDRPLQIEAARPLPVEAVPYTPGRTPGE